MANIINQFGQVKVGFRSAQPIPSSSTVWNNIYSVYNADSVGSSSLKTSLYAVYNGESNANDSFGSNNGTAQGGLTYTSGKIGNAFTFNGTNAVISLPQSVWNFTSDFSFSVWVNLSQLKSDQGILGNSQQLGGAAGEWRGWFLRAGNNKIYFTTMGGGNFSTVISTTSLSTGTWYHIGVTHRLNETKLYINGVLEATNNTAMDAIYHPNKYPSIGNYYYIYGYDSGTYFNGKIDAISSWTKVLTQSEIIELYNSGNGAQYITNDFYKPTTNDALNTYNGTAQGGLTYGVGKVGTAFQFNGSNSSVNLGDNLDIRTSSWSYNVWFNCSSYGSGTYIFSKGRATAESWRFGLSLTSTGKLSPVVISANPTMINPISTQTISTNQWYMATMVVDRSLVSGQYQFVVRLYINGVLETLIGANSFPSNFTLTDFDNIANFRIGSFNDSSNNGNVANFNGSIDAFNVWNKILTQSEITELYNSGNGKQYSN